MPIGIVGWDQSLNSGHRKKFKKIVNIRDYKKLFSGLEKATPINIIFDNPEQNFPSIFYSFVKISRKRREVNLETHTGLPLPRYGPLDYNDFFPEVKK